MFLQEQKKTSIISDVSVFITAVPLIKLFAWGEGSGGHVCVFITAVPIRKLFARGEGDSGGTREEPSTLTQGGTLFSLVPLVWESSPKLQGGWCKPNH